RRKCLDGGGGAPYRAGSVPRAPMPRRGAARLLAAALLVLPVAALAPREAAAQYFGRNKVRYATFDWHILRTEHFDVYYYPEMVALAEQGAAIAEAQYAELESRFDFSLTERVP